MRKNVKRMLAVFLAAIMICSGLVMEPTNTMAATTYTVTNEVELQEALASANDGDIINVGRRFDSTIGPITITEPIELTKDLTINLYVDVAYYYENASIPESVMVINSCDVVIAGDYHMRADYDEVYGYKLIDRDGDARLTLDSRGSLEQGILIVDDASNDYASKLVVENGMYSVPFEKTSAFTYHNGNEYTTISKENITINGGSFEEDIQAYVGADTVIIENEEGFLHRYQVRSTIMSEQFKKLLTDGKIIVPSVVPENQMTEGVEYLLTYLKTYESDVLTYYPAYISDGIFDIMVVNKMTGEQIEIHRVEVEFNPDAIKRPEPQLAIPETNIAGSGFVDDAETVFGAIPFTEEEKAQIEAGAEVTITLGMSDITDTVSDEERKLVEEKLEEDGMTAAMYMDVNITTQVGRETPRNVPDLKSLLLVDVDGPSTDILDPKELMNTKGGIGVYHVGPRGVEEVPSRYNSDNNTIEFQVKSFSTYVIAYKDVAKIPQTGDSTSIATWMMLLAVGGCAITLASKLKKQY